MDAPPPSVKLSARQLLSPQRSPDNVVRQQSSFFTTIPWLGVILDMIPEMVMILNKNRQIVFANKAAMEFFKNHNGIPGIGLRPGEALRCIHAGEFPTGCGSTESCQLCGAFQALMTSQKDGRSVNESRTIQAGTGDAFDLQVTARNLRCNGEDFSVVSFQDINDKKRLRALEHIFFHDIFNTLSTLKCTIALLPDTPPERRGESEKLIKRLSDDIIDELHAQQDLLAAENHELKSHPSAINIRTLLREITMTYRNNAEQRGCSIQIDPAEHDTVIVSDEMLLRRIMRNMIKNALEASSPGEIVTVGCSVKNGWIEFWVRNPSVISREIQLQIFQRSFSTKGSARGLGTYSIKLLTERYLGGKVGFSSAEGEGTRFWVRLPQKPKA